MTQKEIKQIEMESEIFMYLCIIVKVIIFT